MKAKDLAEKLMRHPDFDVVFRFIDGGECLYGVTVREFSVDVDDIGHSDKVIVLGGDEQD